MGRSKFGIFWFHLKNVQIHTDLTNARKRKAEASTAVLNLVEQVRKVNFLARCCCLQAVHKNGWPGRKKKDKMWRKNLKTNKINNYCTFFLFKIKDFLILLFFDYNCFICERSTFSTEHLFSDAVRVRSWRHHERVREVRTASASLSDYFWTKEMIERLSLRISNVSHLL
jgi:hypothetical protein